MMSVQEAIDLTEHRRGEWCLLGANLATGHKTYSCRVCWLQRITLVSPGAVLPKQCPKCGAAQEPPHDEEELLSQISVKRIA